MKTIKAVKTCIETPWIGRVTTEKRFIPADGDILLCEKAPTANFFGRKIILPDDACTKDNNTAIYINRSDLTLLNDGDIVSITEDGEIHALWEESAPDNAIFTTDFCNSACIMCPQIPQGEPFSYFEQNVRMLELVRDSDKLATIGITGGEPTIFKDEIVKLLKLCSKKFPSVPVAMLTNGKNFDDFEFAKKCALANLRMTYCIPLYASYSDKHDYIVGSDGSFVRTINGIYNLIRLRQAIEIRVVILRQNYEDLPLIVDYIYQNMPFIVHVALMGMEITGMADTNCSSVWIDPSDYQRELREAVVRLRRYGLPFSIYNLPRCLLLRELWGFDEDSISSWKKTYLPVCETCCEKERCCGVFATSSKHSSNIKPIAE